MQQGLSTFSGHIKRICELWAQATTHSLVLLDEVGTGAAARREGTPSRWPPRELRQPRRPHRHHQPSQHREDVGRGHRGDSQRLLLPRPRHARAHLRAAPRSPRRQQGAGDRRARGAPRSSSAARAALSASATSRWARCSAASRTANDASPPRIKDAEARAATLAEQEKVAPCPRRGAPRRAPASCARPPSATRRRPWQIRRRARRLIAELPSEDDL